MNIPTFLWKLKQRNNKEDILQKSSIIIILDFLSVEDKCN